MTIEKARITLGVIRELENTTIQLKHKFLLDLGWTPGGDDYKKRFENGDLVVTHRELALIIEEDDIHKRLSQQT